MKNKGTALIVVDMQNAFCSRNGSYWKRGRRIINLEKVLEVNKKLLVLAREKKWTVIFTRLVFNEDYSDGGLLLRRNPLISKLGAYRENTRDSEICEHLKPLKNEVVIIKKRYDPYINTHLEQMLRSRKIKRVIISGVVTDICIESTARSSFDRDFETIIVNDAVTSTSKKLHNASLEILNRSFGTVVSLNELLGYVLKGTGRLPVHSAAL
jgi:ureidoacrylate peracid hydrolase